MDEVRQSLLLKMELEDTRLHAQEELEMRDQEIAHLKHLLASAIRERDQAQQKCHKLMHEKLLLHQSTTPHSGASSVEEDHRYAGFSSSDCDESIVSSPLPPPPPKEAEQELPVLVDRPLPEKGKFLQAVMKAGPLLQNLLLAGPLPQWRHPPPPLDTYQIPPPPVAPQPPLLAGRHGVFDSNNCRKRGVSEIEHSAINELKYQRIVLQ